MKKILVLIFGIVLSIGVFGQTLYAPSGLLGTSTNANVGIGIANPQSRLHIKGDSYNTQTITLQSTVAGNAYTVFSNIEGGWITGLSNDIGGNAKYIINNGTDTRFLIQQDGNVGIGTTTPANKLEVHGTTAIGQYTNGTAVIDAFNSYAYFGCNTPTNGIAIGSTGNVGIGTSTPIFKMQVGNGIPANVDHTNLIFGVKGGLVVANTQGKSLYAHVPDGTNVGCIETYDYGGSVGYNLSINPNGGRVGIGTTNPSANLHLFSTSAKNFNNYLTIENERSDKQSALRIKTGTSNADWVFYIPESTSDFRLYNAGSSAGDRITIKENGNVGIGTTAPAYKLAVKGSIGCSEVQVLDVSAWSDFVLAPDYTLRSLTEVEAFINQNLHLPDVPSEKEVKANGYDVSEMNAILLQKIEELTLYAITQQKEIESVKAENKELKIEVENNKTIELRIEKLEALIDQMNK